MKNIETKKVRDNQQGVVTIVIVILVMLLMSLIVLAMSRNANREQRQALDRQLNTQAFYAAESGVNDFIKNYNSLTNDDGKTCDNPLATSLGEGVEVTCVLFDKDPPELVYNEISLDESKVIPIQSDGEINSLTISFEAKGVTDTDFSQCGAFNSGNLPPRPVVNCDAGVLRIDIAKSINPTRDNLINDTFTIFIVPRNSSPAAGPSSYAYDAGQQGKIVPANCAPTNTPRKCKITITNLFLASNNRVYLNARSIYQPNSMEIGSNTNSFKNAQVLVDSTGKVSDVLKRIQTRVPVHALSISSHPSFSIQSSTDVCKLLQVRPDDTSPGNCSIN
jgi:hypothetical protein